MTNEQAELLLNVLQQIADALVEQTEIAQAELTFKREEGS